MSKINIWEPAQEPEPEPLRLRLFDRGSDIDLVSVDREGNQIQGGIILSITHDGLLKRHLFSRAPHIQTDDHGRIRLNTGG